MARRVVIVGGVRTAFVKSFAQYFGVSNQEMLTHCVTALREKFALQKLKVDQINLGAVMKHAADWNLAREVGLGAGFSNTPGVTVQMACGTGLETLGEVAARIALGQADLAIAGGSDTNSDLPVTFNKNFAHALLRANQAKTFGDRMKALSKIGFKDLKPQIPGIVEPRTGLSMGQHTEKMAKQWGIRREDQDQLALESHQKAAKAYGDGFYKEQVISFNGVEKDTLVRGDTTLEKLAKLKPAFDRSEHGTLTAGNSTSLTDGASVVLVASEEFAKAQGWTPLAVIKDVQIAAVDFVSGEGLLMAPTIAVAEMIKRNKLKLQDFDYYEIHEAFAAQVLCNLKAWESNDYCQKHLGYSNALGSIDRKKMNLKGGSLALGHPFAATGGRIAMSLAQQISDKPGRGLISICAAGGMGITAILEPL